MLKILIWCLFIKLTLSFNLNTLHSIIYEDAHKKLGINVKKSLFGYTTQLYRGKSHASVFIGAPRGIDASIPAGNTGVLFQCPLKQSCEMRKLENRYGRQQSDDYIYIESKDDAWIGGTMDISVLSNRLVVCGFRYSSRAGFNLIGVCYLTKLEDNLKYDKLLPLISPARNTYVFNAKSAVFYYAYGQAGFSAHFTNSRQPNLLLGAPGLLNWYGGSALYTNLDYGTNVVSKQQHTDSFALFGYAVSSGNYTSAHNILYVSSAPRGNKFYGSVVLYKFASKNDKPIEQIYVLSGSQMGEYFGASLATGDLNNDGYDDLVVGAPFYVDNDFNDGRVHVYYGGKNFPDMEGVTHLYGSNDGGQFGSVVTFVGDLNLDGYGDIAVGEPFSDGKHGKVFIYHGGPYGLQLSPTQIVEGKMIDRTLRGFGISVSKGVDIDGNGYPDVSIGAHLSGHVAVLRSNPIVEIISYLEIINGTKINTDNTTWFKHCYSSTKYSTEDVFVHRTLTIDENYQRVTLAPDYQLNTTFVLKPKCETFVLITKERLRNIEEPVKISVHYKLLQETTKANHYVNLNNTDTFCKNCPVLMNSRALENEFSFALKCGSTNVCTSNLSFDVKFFIANKETRTYIIGTSDVRMDVLISNSGDLAYLTQLTIILPMFVRFNYIPKKCDEVEQGQLLCLVGNPLENQVQLSVALNMKEVRSDFGPNITFGVNVTTSSYNKNSEMHKNYTMSLKNDVDVELRKSEPEVFFFNNSFKQVYQISKHGQSPAEQVSLTINLPTHIMKNNISYSIVKLYSIEGSLNGQKFLCRNHSDVEYFKEDINMFESDMIDVVPVTARKLLRREIVDVKYSNNLNESTRHDSTMLVEGKPVLNTELLKQDRVILDCHAPGGHVRCTKFTCDIGTIKTTAVVRIKAMLDTTIIKGMFKIKNTIILKSLGHVDAEHEYSDTDTVTSNNNAEITTIFIEFDNRKPLDMKILICAIAIGLILLMIVTYIFYKCGFFTRKKKLQLEEEKKQAVTEEFINGPLSEASFPEDIELDGPEEDETSEHQYVEIQNTDACKDMEYENIG